MSIAIPNPQPPIQSPIGVFGSLIRIIREDMNVPEIRGAAPQPKNVTFDIRPAQDDMYPSINIKSDGTDPPEYTLEDSKVKVYNVTIEVYGISLSDAELLGEAVERILERGNGPSEDGTCATARIASMVQSDPDGVSIEDAGGESYRTETDWAPNSFRSHMGTLHYRITIRRSF